MTNNREINEPSKVKNPFFYGYIIIIVIFILQMAMFGPRGSFGVFFKPLQNEFGWTRALISGAFSIGTIVQGSSGIIMGGLNDRLGPRIVMTICGFLVGLGFLLMSLTSAVWQLYLFYVVILGIGMGGVYAPQMSTVARWFTTRRNIMTGIVLTGGGIGGLIVPPVATWLISTNGWRFTCILIGSLILVIIIGAAQFLRRDPLKMGQLPYSKNKEREEQKPGPSPSSKAFSLSESIHTKQFWMMAAMMFCLGFCMWTLTVHIVPYSIDLGISDVTAANILAIMNGSIILAVIVFGGIADKIGSARSFIICFVFMLAYLLLLLPITEGWMLGLIGIIIAFGAGGTATLESTLVAELFGVKSHGLILGVISFIYTIGSAAGPFMAGYLFDVRGNYQVAFLVCAALAVVGLLITIGLKPLKV